MTEADITQFIDQLEDKGIRREELACIAIHPADMLDVWPSYTNGDPTLLPQHCTWDGVPMEPNASTPRGQIRAIERKTLTVEQMNQIIDDIEQIADDDLTDRGQFRSR